MTTKAKNPMPTLSPKITQIIKREAALKAQLDQFSDEIYYSLREAALDKARNGNASQADLDEAAAAVDGTLAAKFNGQREAVSLALQAHRIESFPVFRDEFIAPTLQARKTRKEQLQKEIESLNQNYPGANVRLDHHYDSGPISQLQDIAWLDQANGHIDMESLVTFFA